LDAISAEASKHMADYDLQALTWLADFDLHCRDGLQVLLDREVEAVWEKFPDEPDFVDESFLKSIKNLNVDNLGAVGSRLLLNRMGVLETDNSFEDRATETIWTHRREDPREDPNETKFGGPTRHKRVFSYAEYRISGACLTQEFFEGAILQENGARGPHLHATPLRPVPLPINQRVERSACSEFLLLSELCWVLSEAGAVTEAQRRKLDGILRLYSTGPSCLSCITTLWQFHLRYPSISLEVGYCHMQVTTLIALRQGGSSAATVA